MFFTSLIYSLVVIVLKNFIISCRERHIGRSLRQRVQYQKCVADFVCIMLQNKNPLDYNRNPLILSVCVLLNPF